MTCFQGHVNEICFRNISMPVTSELGIFAGDMHMDSCGGVTSIVCTDIVTFPEVNWGQPTMTFDDVIRYFGILVPPTVI